MRGKKSWKDDDHWGHWWSREWWTHPHEHPRPPWMYRPRPGKLRHWRRGWRKSSRRKRGPLFLYFFGIFGFIVLLVLGGMVALAFLLSQFFGGDGQVAVLVWIGGCGLSLALPLLAAGLALWAFRDIATPLADVMAAADAVAEGDLSVRVPVPEHGPREFGRLVGSFNRMTEELERAEQRRRNLTADVAHELRTPLHVIQGNLEGILDDVYEPTAEHISATLDEMRLLARLVDDLRTLSLAEASTMPMILLVQRPRVCRRVDSRCLRGLESQGVVLSARPV